MTITLKKYYIQIQSPSLCTLIGKINGFKNPEDIKAGAFYPFLFLRFVDHPNNQMWINHERIHFRQQLELLFIFYLVIKIIEKIYFRYFKKMSDLDSYLISTFEQECYINQSNSNYLKNRGLFGFLNYMFNKKKITFIDNNGNINIE